MATAHVLPRLRCLLCCCVLLMGGCAAAVSAVPSPAPAPPLAQRPTPPRSPTPQAARPSAAPTSVPPLPTSTPSPAAPLGYLTYAVRPGDTLESISAWGGTTPELVRSYNRLTGEPQPGRALVIPQMQARTSALPAKDLVVVRGNTSKPWVALTLDCGGRNRHTYAILDALKAAHVHITFFLLGESIAEDPVLLARMVSEGHELASHSYTHRDFTKLSDAEIVDELQRTESLIHSLVGARVSLRPYFRFPYGAYNGHVLHTVIGQGYLPIHWTLDSLDSIGKPKTPEFVAERLTKKLSTSSLRGAILLSHCTTTTAAALPAVLAQFAAEGIEVHTLSDVLGP